MAISAILIAHVTCGVLGIMLCVPLAVLLPRYARSFLPSRWWVRIHALLAVLALALVVIAFGIGLTFGTATDSWHSITSPLGSSAGFVARQIGKGVFAEGQSLGLTLFILIILQASLGATAHLFKIPHRLQTKDGRGPANYLHPIVGLGVMGVGWATLYAAMVQQWPSRKRPVLNVGWMVGWGLVVAVVSLLYLAGLALLPRQWRADQIRTGDSGPQTMGAMKQSGRESLPSTADDG